MQKDNGSYGALYLNDGLYIGNGRIEFPQGPSDKYEVEGSPSDGYRIWRTDAQGDVHEQESPPFHTPCEAWWWGFKLGIDSEIVGFEMRPENNCRDCLAYHEMMRAKQTKVLIGDRAMNIQTETIEWPLAMYAEPHVDWNGAKHSRIKTKARGHAAYRKGKRKAQRAARKGK